MLPQLCDFGYSKHDTLDSVAKSKVGTPGYTAPGGCWVLSACLPPDPWLRPLGAPSPPVYS